MKKSIIFLLSIFITITSFFCRASSDSNNLRKIYFDLVSSNLKQATTIGELAENIDSPNFKKEVLEYVSKYSLRSEIIPGFSIEDGKMVFETEKAKKLIVDFSLVDEKSNRVSFNGRVVDLGKVNNFENLMTKVQQAAGHKLYFSSAGNILLPRAWAGLPLVAAAIVATGVSLYSVSDYTRPCWGGDKIETVKCFFRDEAAVLKKLTKNRPIRQMVCENGKLKNLKYSSGGQSNSLNVMNFNSIGTSTFEIETFLYIGEKTVPLCKYKLVETTVVKVVNSSGGYNCPAEENSHRG